MCMQYERGDDEHKMIWDEFSEWLTDLPFVVLGIMLVAVPWREVILVRELFKVSA